MTKDAKVFRRMIEVDDLNHTFESVFHHAPDPLCAIGREDNLIGCVVTARDGLCEKCLRE